MRMQCQPVSPQVRPQPGLGCEPCGQLWLLGCRIPGLGRLTLLLSVLPVRARQLQLSCLTVAERWCCPSWLAPMAERAVANLIGRLDLSCPSPPEFEEWMSGHYSDESEPWDKLSGLDW